MTAGGKTAASKPAASVPGAGAGARRATAAGRAHRLPVATLWRAGLMLWLGQVLLTPYLEVNALNAPWAMRGFAALAVGLALGWRLWPRWRVLWLGALASALLGAWWLLLPAVSREGQDLPALGRQLVEAWHGLIARGGVNVAALLAAGLGLLFVLALAVLGVRLVHPYLALLLVLWYVLMVHAVNGNPLVGASLQLLAIACLINAGSWRGVLARGAVAAAIAGGATLGVTYFSDPLDVATVPVRNWVNASGLYDVLLAMTAENARTGYSDNDTTLGGPVYDDTTPVFAVRAKSPFYLRVTAKTDYTGRGWTEVTDQRVERQRLHYEDGNLHGFEDAEAAAYGEPMAATITAQDTITYFGLPNADVGIKTVAPGEVSDLFYDYASARLYRGRQSGIRKLTMTVALKRRDPEALRQIETVPEAPEDIQLPSALPKRIARLAERVTQGADNDYDRAVAIERYLRTEAGLTYSKVDTPQTPRGRDYVDHFLFTSKVGYCDNFSSAMVVMLRSLGIPARWAKGFNQGTAVGDNTYSITNANAHSWPEVDFGDTFGWVDFEPTPGFGGTTPTPLATPVAQAASESTSSAASSSSASVKSAVRAQSASSAAAPTATATTTGHAGAVLAVIAGVLALALWLVRRKLLALAASVHLTPQNFPRRYRLLLYALAGVHRRPPSQNLVAYATAVEARLPLGGALTTLTTAYEAAVYGARPQAPTKAFRQVARGLPWRGRR
ncbi:DUF4129 domain-containing transglutaminase family protein [Lacticaseibacillus kribbianus]|uniref:DUF4129 domain-containing transglutaminase family protein n=1 Tax=Lacticaseibacillus kribbianus TaxID=2926292 RepID=UPI001CD519F5|nr:transglutaminase domain-containing protein [Lacticaseibacillus kribbianus]